jgi:hypothetical protein
MPTAKTTIPSSRVARWYSFKQKNPNSEGLAIEDVGMFMAIWSILRIFGLF